MKNIILFLLSICSVSWAQESIAPMPSDLLRKMQAFEILLVDVKDEINRDSLFASIKSSFNKYSQVTITETSSQMNSNSPVCFFSVSHQYSGIEISLKVFAQVEVQINKQKTLCPVWENKVFKILTNEKPKDELVISSLMQELIDKFSQDWQKVNQLGDKNLNFHCRKYTEITPVSTLKNENPIEFPLK